MGHENYNLGTDSLKLANGKTNNFAIYRGKAVRLLNETTRLFWCFWVAMPKHD